MGLGKLNGDKCREQRAWGPEPCPVPTALDHHQPPQGAQGGTGTPGWTSAPERSSGLDEVNSPLDEVNPLVPLQHHEAEGGEGQEGCIARHVLQGKGRAGAVLSTRTAGRALALSLSLSPRPRDGTAPPWVLPAGWHSYLLLSVLNVVLMYREFVLLV